MIPLADMLDMAGDKYKDAVVLYRAGRFGGAYYLSGYSVEFVLKWRIAFHLGWSGFPDTADEFKDCQSLKVHRFDSLIKFTGREGVIKPPPLGPYWDKVKQWDPEKRYRLATSISRVGARGMILACKKIRLALTR